MKKITYLALLSMVLCAFTSQSSYNYHDEATLKGVVSTVDYDLPAGGSYVTYVLKLDQEISLNASDEWDAKNGVTEIQLSIQEHKILRYKNKPIEITGELFGAVNEHHRRDVCIKVSEINGG
ncbi:MAG: DUF4431 domain-containing protein [Flammeovirgaceae bacterium]